MSAATPMLGPFDALSDELVVKLIQTCGAEEAPRLALLNKRFCGLCSPAVFVPLFRQRWGFASVDPCLSIRDMASLQLSQFVHLCKLERGDTLQSLALRHSCTEMDLRVLNNLLSERALSAYSSLFVPVSDEAQLQGKVLRLQHVGAMHRVLPVVCAEDEPPLRDAPDAEAVSEASLSAYKSHILAAALNTDTKVSSFYLEQAGGDLREARDLYRQDQDWEWSGEGQALLRAYQDRKCQVWRAQCGVCTLVTEIARLAVHG